jgi:hypothetical protein
MNLIGPAGKLKNVARMHCTSCPKSNPLVCPLGTRRVLPQ